MRILVAEDEKALQRLIINRLKDEGYGVDACDNGEDALEFLRQTRYDCAVLDIMMPRLNGLSVLKSTRTMGIKVPILILTAKTSISDRVLGLDAGADDYLTKPFSFEELMARIRSLSRRASEEKTNIFSAADLTLDLSSHLVFRGGNEIELTSKEYSILEYMLRNKGKILSRSQIAENVWDYSFECESNIIDVYIRFLRSKIDDPYDSKLIKTVRNRGYTLREN